MVKLILKPRIAPRIAAGHPWVFASEVAGIEGAVQPGDLVEVCYADGKYCGTGFINTKSQIIVRLLTRKGEKIDEAFLLERIGRAWNYRVKTGYTENCRLVFGEADFLPSLIIDKFNDYYCLQTLSYGM